MKSLWELQQEVRQLEEELRNLCGRLGQIGTELAELRQTDADVGIDFAAIERCARLLSFRAHPLTSVNDPGAARIYLTGLLTLVGRDTEPDGNQLIFVQWILYQCGIGDRLADLLKASYQVNKHFFQQLGENLDGDLARSFLLDLMIMAGLSSPISGETLEYIGELAACFHCGEEQMRQLSLAARCTLCQSTEGLTCEDAQILCDTPGYSIYLSGKAQEGLRISRRRIAVRVRVDLNPEFDLRWAVQGHSLVKKGELLAVLSTGSGRKKKSEFYAQVPGRLYRFRNNHTEYGVIAAPDDDKSSIKNWVKQQEGT